MDIERFMRFASRGMPRTRRGLIVFFAVQWSFVGAVIVFLIVVTSQKGPDEVFWKVLVPLSILLGVVMVGAMVALGTTIPGRIRAKSLMRRHPEAVVTRSTLSMWDREAITAIRRGKPTSRLLLFSAALLFDSGGISVWTGVRAPECIANLPWSEVTSIRVLDETPTWLVVSTLMVACADGREMQFTMFSGRRLGLALARRPEMEALVSRLRDLANLNG
jgi:hypothetical protein